MFLKDIHTYTYTLGVKNTTESGRMWEILVVSVEQMQNMDRTMGHGRLPERAEFTTMTGWSCGSRLAGRTRPRSLPDLRAFSWKGSTSRQGGLYRILGGET